MTINNTTQASYTRVNTQKSPETSSANTQQVIMPRDTTSFSEAAKQLAQEHVHSQSGASGTWSQSSALSTQPNTQTSTTDLQSLLMKSILSAYSNSGSQNSRSMNLTV
ncbi:MAG: hypothetical protein PHX13_05610 [Thiovulaceae bacterium]|nr:hypothetical protein [Sulfurimonadaceae bacterium]